MSHFPSSYDMMQAEVAAARKDRDKCHRKVDAADQKLQAFVRKFVAEGISPALAAAAAECQANLGDLSMGSDASGLRRDMEKLVAASTDSLTAERDKAMNSMRLELESSQASQDAGIAQLRAELATERDKRVGLEEKLEEMARKLDAHVNASCRTGQGQPTAHDEDGDVEMAHPDADSGSNSDVQVDVTTKVMARVDEAKNDLVTRDQLVEALQDFDANVSAGAGPILDRPVAWLGTRTGQRTRQKLTSIEKATERVRSALQTDEADELPPCVQVVRTDVERHEMAMKEHSKHQAEAKRAMERVEQAVAKLEAEMAERTAGAGAAQASAEYILQVTKQPLMTAMGGISKFINDERDERRKDGEQAKQTAADLARLRGEYVKLVEDNKGLVLRLGSSLDASLKRLAAVEADLAAVQSEGASQFDELQLQMKSVQTWQNNFTTRPLFNDIVKQMRETIPSGYTEQLRELTSRMQEIEGQVGASNKRRKTMAEEGAATARPGAQ